MATQDDIDNLEAAINGGELIVQFADRRVEYRSLDEMERILAKLRAEVSGETPRRSVRVATKSGWRA